MMEDGLPPGGDGADDDAAAAAAASLAQEGGAPADNGADHAEAAFEAQSRSKREDKAVQRLLRDRADLRRQLSQVTAQRDAAYRAAMSASAANVDAEIERARAAKRQAFNDGDADGDVAATEQLHALLSRKAQLDSAPRQIDPAPAALSAETEEWIERNPRFRTDPQWNAAAMAAHKAAVDLGYAPDAADYFRFVENQIERRYPGTVNRAGGEQAKAQQEDEDVISTERQQAAPQRQSGYRGPSPVSRAAAAPARTTGRVADAIPANMRARVEEGAKATGQSVQVYWSSVRRLANDGKINLDTFRS